MRRLSGSRQRSRDEGGFTLVEVAVSLSLVTVIALALAGVLHSGLRALGAAKARAQGNDIATQGIEDLQRFGFNSLGLCGTYSPPATPPTGLTELYSLPNCPASLPSYDCNTAVGGTVPLAQYGCQRNNITYTVRRYVAWVDPLHTTKRLAVFVDWTDLTGNHQVSQQSSLRAPDQAAVVGLSPPAFSTPLPAVTTTPTGPVALTTDGKLPDGTELGLTAATQNLNGSRSTTFSPALPTTRAAGEPFTVTVASFAGFPTYNGFPVKIGAERFTVLAGAGTTSWQVSAEAASSASLPTTVVFEGDQVYANFDTVDPSTGNAQTSTVFLSSSDGTAWSGTLTSAAGYTFSPGAQHFSFGILRAADGKATAAFATEPVRFCPSADPSCSTLLDPVVTAPDVAAVLDPSGALVAPLTITATTRNITSGDAVTVSFVTSAGVVSQAMQQDPAGPECDAPTVPPPNTECRWTTTIKPSEGNRFSTGPQRFYVKARQLPDNDPATVDDVSTGAAVATVTF